MHGPLSVKLGILSLLHDQFRCW